MIKKTIKYHDYDGNEREEDFYFNLSRAEVLEMEFECGGNLAEHLRTIVAAKNIKLIGEKFKELIAKSYGIKSSDGKYFVKSDEETKKFFESEAYSELYMELATNGQASAEFVNGIIPKSLSGSVPKNLS